MTPENLKDKIRPGSESHGKLLSKFLGMLKLSEEKMSTFYNRWNYRELQYQAFVPTKDWEEIYKRAKEDVQAPVQKLVPTLVVPYMFSTIRTIVTYLSTVFLARKPLFTVGANNSAFIEAARNMETLLQYNAEHSKFVMHCTQWLYDGEIYGVGAMRTGFVNEKRKKTQFVENPLAPGEMLKVQNDELIYQGNTVERIDPFLFFPDPRVPMMKVAKEGEFVFWRNYVGKFALQKTGEFEFLDDSEALGQMARDSDGESLRNMYARGDSLNNGQTDNLSGNSHTMRYVQVDEGTVELIPSELGLGDSDLPQKFLVTIANKHQIIRLEPFENDHGMHPVAVIEPYGLGGFGNLGISDYLSPIQEMISWLLNSHIQNVKGSLNNSFIYDPSMINEKDLRSDAPNKCIRVRPKAYGVDVSMYLKQLDVRDATANNVNDITVLTKIGDALSAVNENYRGLQDSGGRKTATEIRATIEAATSRLASHAQYISATGMQDLGVQWSMNNQQYLTQMFETQVLGQDGMLNTVIISPESINGDFYFPIHDGSLPIDKIALFDIWTQVLQFTQGDQEIRSVYSLPKIFEFVAKLGGAENIDQFKMQVASPDVLQQQAQAGNLVPVPTRGGANGQDLSAMF